MRLNSISTVLLIAVWIILLIEIVVPQESKDKRQDLPILDRLFPTHSIDAVWEVNPLLVAVSRKDESRDGICFSDSSDGSKKTCVASSEYSKNNKNTTIPTIYLPESSEKERIEMFNSIFNLNNIDTLLESIVRDPEAEHQKHYKVIKKVITSDGEQRNAMLPSKKLDINTIKRAMNEGHFSLVVNNLHHWWGTVASFSRMLREETMCGYVSCNLYLTPEHGDAMNSGFESHYDWMDVFVIQIAGRKLWSVASQPTEYLPDLNRAVTKEQLKDFEETRYDDILLQPGDVLYIPRGFVHNASTLMGSQGQTANHIMASSKSGDGQQSPSLHLTFGIEHGCATTMEMLLHRALDAFVQHNGISTAIPRHQCQSDQDITWDMILHVVIMDVTRTVPCKHHQSNQKSTNPCELRKAVPFHPVWSHIFYSQQQQEQQQRQQQRETNRNEDDVLKNLFLRSLKAVATYAKVQRTAEFIHSIQTSSDELMYSCLPKILPSIDILLCHPSITAGLHDKDLNKYIQKFISFAKDNLPTALHILNSRTKQELSQKVQNEEQKLKLLGQSVPSR